MPRNIEKGFGPGFGEKEGPLQEKPKEKAATEVEEETAEKSFEKEPQQKIALTELFGSVKKRIGEAVADFLRRPDKEVRMFEKTLKKSVEVSREAGNFYRFLIPRTLKEPEKEYTGGERKSVLEQERETFKEIDLLQKKMSHLELDIMKSLMIGEQVEIEDDEEIAKGKFSEREVEDGYFVQFYRKNFLQPEGKNIIGEVVTNYLRKEGNIAEADLVIKDRTMETKIDLSHLLPEGFYFTPDDLYKTEDVFSEETGETKEKVIPVNLKAYKGNRNSTGSFSCWSRRKWVQYGDITKKGGILRLFHEVSHSWQAAYYENCARVQFENFYKQANRHLPNLAYFERMRGLAKKKGKTEVEKQCESFKEERIKELKKLGVEIDEERFKSDIQKLEEGESRIKCLDGVFVIKSEKLNELIADYEKEERDAWAHAVRALRFLRKRGIDLEPQLKTLSDFKEVIDPALGSYQRYMENRIESVARKLGFIKGGSRKRIAAKNQEAQEKAA